jgi:Xaa-Pro aminopeptidase
MTPVPSQGVDREALALEIAARRAALATAMADQGIEALVVTSEANIHYLTGYETTVLRGNKSKPVVVVFAPPERPHLIAHPGESPSAELDAIDVDVVEYIGPDVLEVPGGVQIDYHMPATAVTLELLGRLGVRSIGVEESWHFMPGLTPLAFDHLRKQFPGDVIDASPALWQVRRVKSEWEIAQMKLAADVAAEAHRVFRAEARLGMSERDLTRLLRRAAYDAGAEKIGYSGIIAGIDRAPMGGPTNRRWEKGQMLFVDICPQVGGGYFADFDRIYASATPTSEQERAYAAVVDSLERAYEVLRAGVRIDELANAMIGDVPTVYARVGHGLGLEMPEPPSLSPRDPTPLRAGEVICIEPNQEVPGIGWLVSEEQVVVREDGFELQSPPFPRELEVIG